MKKKLHIVDQRMLEISDLLKEKGEIRFKQEMWDAIDMKKQTISNIRKGTQHFTVRQIENTCRVYGVDANFIFGLSDSEFRKVLPVTKTVTKGVTKLIKTKKSKK